MNPYYAVKTTNFIFTKIPIVNNICKQTIPTLAIYRRIYLTESSDCRSSFTPPVNRFLSYLFIWISLLVLFELLPLALMCVCVCVCVCVLASLACCITLATPQPGHMFLSVSPSPGLTFHRLCKIISNTLIPSHWHGHKAHWHLIEASSLSPFFLLVKSLSVQALHPHLPPLQPLQPSTSIVHVSFYSRPSHLTSVYVQNAKKSLG